MSSVLLQDRPIMSDRIAFTPRYLTPSNERPGFSLRIATRFEELEPLAETLDRLLFREGGAVYLTYDWLRLWWQFYGVDGGLRVFLCYVGEDLAGFIPLFIQDIRLWPLRLRVAKPLAISMPTRLFTPVIGERFGAAFCEDVVCYLLEKEHCDFVSLGPISKSSFGQEAIEQMCMHLKDSMEIRKQCIGVQSCFHLPDSLEEYFKALSSSERKKRKYELRLLSRECNIRSVLLKESQDVEACVEYFVKQHTEQWEAEGKSGHFGAWPSALTFNEQLIRVQAKKHRVRFATIVADDEIVSMQYAFAFGDSYYWELPSRAVGKKWDRMSLGPAGLILMIDEAIKEGMKKIEGGIGHYDYKVRLGATEYPVWRYSFIRKEAKSKGRIAAFGALRWTLAKGYHKLWYRRISPRLPASLRRPQWRFWTRLDF